MAEIQKVSLDQNEKMLEKVKEGKKIIPTNNETDQKFVTDVDPNVSHWQAKETEFFTVQFPKEWYWLEAKHGEGERYSEVITNNPNFYVNKYLDISNDAGIKYPITLTNDTEIIVIIKGVGVTFEEETPLKSIDWQIKRMKKLYSNAICRHTETDIFPTAFCSVVNEDKQRV